MTNFRGLPESNFHWEEDQLFFGTDPIGTIKSRIHPGFPFKDEIEEIELGVFRWTRSFSNRSSETIALQKLELGFETAFTTDYAMIPAVNYNGNEWGSGLEPKGFTKDHVPWTFAFHRTAVAGATFSNNKMWSTALFGEYQDSGFSCSLLPEKERTLHSLIWPLEEMPLVYDGRDRYSEGYRETWSIEPGREYRVTAYIVVDKIKMNNPPWKKMLEVAWALNVHEQKPGYPADRIWELGIRYVKESLWAEEGIFKGTSIGLRTCEDGWEHRPEWKYKIGWTGQNISLGNSLLYDYLITGDQSSLEMGSATLDSWADHARLPNGLIRCHFDYLLPDSVPERTETQDAVHLGDAAMNFFEAADLAEQCGISKPSYLETAMGICDFAMSQQNAEGKIGKSWYNNGASADPEGTIGCALVSPLVKAYERTGSHHYLEAAEKGYTFYIKELLDNGFTTAGALDTYCIDKEAAIPLLEAGLLIYQATGNQQYVNWAEYASWYLSSWQWHHTVPYPEGSVMQQLSYNTFGGTSVSTQHHHLDPYALKFTKDWLALGEAANNEIWTQRAKAAWSNGTIGISDGTLRILDKERPVGSQDEGFYHTRWGFISGHQPFGVSQWLVAWPTAFRLETLRKVADWSIFNS